MTHSKRKNSDKIETLKKQGSLNPRPEKVVDSLFGDNLLAFFDPNDLVQVKYEMLRSVEKEGYSVTEAARKFGFSRPSFYHVLSEFRKNGINGLIRKRPGPTKAHKLKDEIMEFIDSDIKEGEPLRSRTLAPKIEKQFGTKIHPRSIERAMERKKKLSQRK
jgi:transposase